MYDEHTWGAHSSIWDPDSDFVKQQDDFKQQYAKRGAQRVDSLLEGFEVGFFSGRPDFSPVRIDAEAGTVDNGVLSLKIDRNTGSIVSLKRKGIEHDLVQGGADGNASLNDYLYILGRNAAENRERYDNGGEISKIEDAAAEEFGLIVKSPAPNCETLTRTITLQPGGEVVKITNVMQKRLERRPEGTFFGFPFQVPDGIWRVDIPWATVQVEKDQLPGANRNYYCVQRFCNLSNEHYGIDWITVDAPMVQFSPILFTEAWDRELKQWREHIEPDGTIYSWVCNNHWETNYKAGQEGTLEFTYLIRPHLGSFDAARSKRFAMGRGRSLFLHPLLDCGNENVLITRLKPAREILPDSKPDSPFAQGWIVRLHNPTDQPQEISLKFSAPQRSKSEIPPEIYLSNPWEDRLEKISPEMKIDPLDIVTLRIE